MHPWPSVQSSQVAGAELCATGGREGGWHCRRVLGQRRKLSREAENIKRRKKNHPTQRPRRDLNPQSSDPESDALSIRPRGPVKKILYNFFHKASLGACAARINVCAPSGLELCSTPIPSGSLWAGLGPGQLQDLAQKALRGLLARPVVANSRSGRASQAPPTGRGPLGSLCPHSPGRRWVRSCPLLHPPLCFLHHSTAKPAMLCSSPVASDWTLTVVKAEAKSPAFPRLSV